MVMNSPKSDIDARYIGETIDWQEPETLMRPKKRYRCFAARWTPGPLMVLTPSIASSLNTWRSASGTLNAVGAKTSVMHFTLT